MSSLFKLNAGRPTCRSPAPEPHRALRPRSGTSARWRACIPGSPPGTPAPGRSSPGHRWSGRSAGAGRWRCGPPPHRSPGHGGGSLSRPTADGTTEIRRGHPTQGRAAAPLGIRAAAGDRPDAGAARCGGGPNEPHGCQAANRVKVVDRLTFTGTRSRTALHPMRSRTHGTVHSHAVAGQHLRSGA